MASQKEAIKETKVEEERAMILTVGVSAVGLILPVQALFITVAHVALWNPMTLFLRVHRGTDQT